MKKLYTDKEFERMTDEYDKVKYLCKCGHRVIIPEKYEKRLCNWCQNYVFKTKEDEFKYRLRERMRKIKCQK